MGVIKLKYDIMNQFEEFKKVYITLKADYLKVDSDLDYVTKAKSTNGGVDHEWANTNYESIRRDSYIAFHRLKLVTECIFEMNMDATHDVKIMAKGQMKDVRTAINFKFINYGNDRGCFGIAAEIYVFRSYEYYDQLLKDSNNDIRESIDFIFHRNEHGIVDLPKLQADLIDIAFDDKSSDSNPIGVVETAITDDDFLECGLDTIRKRIDDAILDAARTFISNFLNIGKEF